MVRMVFEDRSVSSTLTLQSQQIKLSTESVLLHTSSLQWDPVVLLSLFDWARLILGRRPR